MTFIAAGMISAADGEGAPMVRTRLNDRFLLECELGRGGMGAVYRAVDDVLGRTVAIKVLPTPADPEVGKQVRREAQILARLIHAHIVRLYDFGETGAMSFLVMEEVTGSTFKDRWPNLELGARLAIVAQVADALDHAHHQGIIHRDVKPANILLTASDQARLSDFGLSLAGDHTQESGILCGTPHYMSPEQAGGRRLDRRTDLYSLGVVLYECATGVPPFDGPMLSIVGQHLHEDPVPPSRRNPEISARLESLILGLMSKDACGRPESGRAVADALREMIRADDYGVSACSTRTLIAPMRHTFASVPSGSMSVDPAGATVRADVGGRVPGPSPELPPWRRMIDSVEADPIVLTPEQRYLGGHYLAFLLGGTRRGFLGRRPLDSRNAERARLMLAMTSVMMAGGTEESVALAAELLEERPDVRASLSPVVVAKYLASRETSAKRKVYRDARRRLQLASPYAREHMTDAKGILNPGLMPRTYTDLRLIAPAREEVDDQLIARWNRLSAIWREDAWFRRAVLRYSTRRAHRDPAAVRLWPEVVYPLIERAGWQRRHRTRPEAIWDAVCRHVLHVVDGGLRLDRAMSSAIPEAVRAELEREIDAFGDQRATDARDPMGPDSEALAGLGFGPAVVTDRREADGAPLVPLSEPEPLRLSRQELRSLWNEAASPGDAGPGRGGHRGVAVGPYRLSVVTSRRGHLAGKVVIQDKMNRRIEVITPSFSGGGPGAQPLVAVWIYRDDSLVVAHLDFQGQSSYIFWDSPSGQQTNFDDPDELADTLYHKRMEQPGQLDLVLSRRFQPASRATR